MITLRKAGDRFHTNIDWLDSWHTFSFGEHYDPQRAGFSALRVINDDTVQPGQGFGAHPHRDMEILSYVLSGGLAHRDSSGGGGVIRPGDVQRMSAGSGVVHSEFNASREEPVHFLQILAPPREAGHRPGLRAEDVSLRGAARPAPAARLARRAAGVGHHPPGRRGLRRAPRQGRARLLRAPVRPQRLGARGARFHRPQRRAPFRGRRSGGEGRASARARRGGPGGSPPVRPPLSA